METQQATTHDVVQALLDQVVIEDVQERRRSRRHACFGGISVSAVETYHSVDELVFVAAVTKDVAEEGLSFLCPRFLRVGTPLSVRFHAVEDRPVLECVVRNVVHLGGEYHRVGAEFTL